MKEHFCSAEKSMITYEGSCNWCGQKEWVGLTDEEISELIRATHNTGSFARAIEAKLKQRNT